MEHTSDGLAHGIVVVANGGAVDRSGDASVAVGTAVGVDVVTAEAPFAHLACQRAGERDVAV